MKIVFALFALAALSGCATAPNGQTAMTDQGRTALGTVAGGALGGYFGNRISDGSPTGTAIGAIGGAAVGNALFQPSYPSGYQNQNSYRQGNYRRGGYNRSYYGRRGACRGQGCWY